MNHTDCGEADTSSGSSPELDQAHGSAWLGWMWAVLGLLLIVILFAISACESTPPRVSNSELAVQQRQATHDFIKCAITHERELDDRVSDASTVAFALTNRCIVEYNSVTDVGLVTTDRHLLLMWKQSRTSPQKQIEASLDIVLSIRSGATVNPNY